VTLAQIRQIIEQRFADYWVDNNVAYENVPYIPPDEDLWLRLAVQVLTRNYNGLGECIEIIGMVSVQILSPLRTGAGNQDSTIDEVLAIYTGDHSGIAYQDSQISTVGEISGWYMSNLFIGFKARG
jgi:hypothetical protein